MPTEAELRELYPRAPEANIRSFVDHHDELFERFGVDRSSNRLQFFLAQIGHESGGLTVTSENLNYRAERLCAVWPSRFPSIEAASACEHNPEKLANTVYCDRMGNGPAASGDGWRYRGRGYIQITGRDGYRSVGEIAALDLVANPDLANAPEHALPVACAFWQWKGLNALCDGGDFVTVTQRINGGTTGLEDRRAWLDKVRRIVTVSPPPDEQPSAELVIAIQRALQARGYAEVGAADGMVGRRTMAAIARFRAENGMPAGSIDEGLREALAIFS